ncbi:hypothetical protein [Haloarcula amylovorans]|uniref:hypothetical protein n=1 Tax=Haloarcula amylovorans TaxID=2562280 RepID=UPI00107639AF|nr:hypothetical protein [Halomicroarcula amylolytica]
MPEVAAVWRFTKAVNFGEETFVEQMIENVPTKPDNYETVININQGGESVDISRNVQDGSEQLRCLT